MHPKTLPKLIYPLAIGLVAISAYFVLGSDVLKSAKSLQLLIEFSIGPLAIYGMHLLYRDLNKIKQSSLLKVAILYLIISFTLLTLMLVVQESITQGLSSRVEKLSDNYGDIFQALNLLQLAIDIAFDLFYSIGLGLLGLVILQHPLYSPVNRAFLGGTAVIIAIALLTLNLRSFPFPPGSSGSFDVGPMSALWWLLFLVNTAIRQKQTKHL